jgi:hypothetical protein
MQIQNVTSYDIHTAYFVKPLSVELSFDCRITLRKVPNKCVHSEPFDTVYKTQYRLIWHLDDN